MFCPRSEPECEYFRGENGGKLDTTSLRMVFDSELDVLNEYWGKVEIFLELVENNKSWSD